jgi:hypothetical protein
MSKRGYGLYYEYICVDNWGRSFGKEFEVFYRKGLWKK